MAARPVTAGRRTSPYWTASPRTGGPPRPTAGHRSAQRNGLVEGEALAPLQLRAWAVLKAREEDVHRTHRGRWIHIHGREHDQRLRVRGPRPHLHMLGRGTASRTCGGLVVVPRLHRARPALRALPARGG